MVGKSRVVTFRLDEATWDWMRRLAPYTKYRTTSSFIREGIDLLLKREDEQPSGWTVGRPRRG
jgi:Arc/MetJ-type ribon-helix-helix transcriptional regulator